jgi:hypothetical protein
MLLMFTVFLVLRALGARRAHNFWFCCVLSVCCALGAHALVLVGPKKLCSMLSLHVLLENFLLT